MSKEFEKLNGDISQMEAEQVELNKRLDDYQKEIREHDEILADMQRALEAAAEIKALKAHSEGLHKKEQGIVEEKHQSLSEAWKDLLRPLLATKAKHLQRDVDHYVTTVKERAAVEAELSALERSLRSDRCRVCGQPTPAEKRSEIGSEVARLQARRQDLTSDDASFSVANNSLQRIRGLLNSRALEQVCRLESESTKVNLDIAKTESRLSELEQEVRGHDTAEGARRRGLRDKLNQQVGAVKEEMGRIRSKLEVTERKREEISKLLGKDATARRRQGARETAIYLGLERVFSDAIDLLRDRLRESVAKLATDTFLSLTTESEYAKLDINSHYGLTIVDRRGRTVPLRSAGAEQVVALSLIAGLNKKSGRGLPMIMDTPLGRLDPKHRKNIMENLPRMASQIVLLAHEGEIEPDKGLEPIASRIGAVYHIRRVSASHSEIVKG
jgi:DNA sulfur modification protein DndD